MSVTLTRNTKVFVSNEAFTLKDSGKKLTLENYTDKNWSAISHIEKIGELKRGHIFEIACARDGFDLGQIQLRAASAESLPRAYKIVFPDNSTLFFRANYSDTTITLGTAEDIICETFGLEVSSHFIEVTE
jgi:hypothetical protein